MAQSKFEGDLTNISPRQLEFIDSVLVELGFTNSKVTFGPVGKAGDNYSAIVKRITVEGENGNFSMIAKLAHENQMLRMIGSTGILFGNEHKMYYEILPKYVQLQKEAGVPEEDQLKYAKCYGSFAESPYEVILLEDLNRSDFRMLSRFESLSNECIKSVLKNFALLHSLSYVIKHKEPETHKDFKESLIDMWEVHASIDQMKFIFNAIEDVAVSLLDDPVHINAVRHKVSGAVTLWVKMAKADKDNKYAVILQRDAWTNNLMFRFEGDKLLESIMIDYQLSNNGNPVYDLMYFIFNCTDHETRTKHYYEWIDYYHSELDKSLSNFNLKVNFIYPRDKLDADLKRYGKLMLGLNILMAGMMIRKSEDAAKMMEMMNSDQKMAAMQNQDMSTQAQQMGLTQVDEETALGFRTKIIGLINSYTEFGLL